MFDVDIRRFAPFHANRRHLADRTVETLGLHYAMRWPREELATVRPLRRSPLYDRLKAKGAVFGSKLELGARELFSAARRAASRRTRSARPAGCRTCSRSSARAARTSSCSIRRRSRNSSSRAATRWPCCSGLCANEIDVPVGRMVYTAMLNARGGFESDLTITRLADERVLHRDRLGAGARATSRGSSGTSARTSMRRWSTSRARTRVISVMGPKSEALLSRAVARRSVEGRRCRSRRRARSTSATRACAPRG